MTGKTGRTRGRIAQLQRTAQDLLAQRGHRDLTLKEFCAEAALWIGKFPAQLRREDPKYAQLMALFCADRSATRKAEFGRQYLEHFLTRADRAKAARRAAPKRTASTARFSCYSIYTYRPGKFEAVAHLKNRADTEKCALVLSRSWPGVMVVGLCKQNMRNVVLFRVGTLPTNIEASLNQ